MPASPLDANRYCPSCRLRKPAIGFDDTLNVCRECRKQDATLRRQMVQAGVGVKTLREAAAAIEKQAEKIKFNIPALSEVVSTLMSDFGGVADFSKFVASLARDTKTHPKIKLECAKFVTNLLVAAHQIEGQEKEFEEMGYDEMVEVWQELAEMHGFRIVWPDEPQRDSA